MAKRGWASLREEPGRHPPPSTLPGSAPLFLAPRPGGAAAWGSGRRAQSTGGHRAPSALPPPTGRRGACDARMLGDTHSSS